MVIYVLPLITQGEKNVTVYIDKYGVFMKKLFQFSVLSRPFVLGLVC